MEKLIPNFNTFSTLVDRLSIENVKLAHFENAIEHDNLSADKIKEFQAKVTTQNVIIGKLKQELTQFMRKVFIEGGYDYVKEERTFQ